MMVASRDMGEVGVSGDSSGVHAMTRHKAAEIVRRKWDENDGCRSCGWKSCLYEFGDILDHIDEQSIKDGFVTLPCFTDWGDGHEHRGARVYLNEDESEVES
jgi:hypothetical protein